MTIDILKKEYICDIAEISKISIKDSWSESLFEGEIENASNYAVAVEGGKAVGFCGIIVTCGEACITNIAVHPDFRNRGIANALMETIISVCVKNRYEFLTLEVRASNEPAISLYKKFGFENAGLRQRYYKDGENAVIMTKYFN